MRSSLFWGPLIAAPCGLLLSPQKRGKALTPHPVTFLAHSRDETCFQRGTVGFRSFRYDMKDRRLVKMVFIYHELKSMVFNSLLAKIPNITCLIFFDKLSKRTALAI